MCHYSLSQFLYLAVLLFPYIILCILEILQYCISEKIYLNILFKVWFSTKIFKIKPKGIEWTEIDFWFCTDWKRLLYNSHFTLLRYHNLHSCLCLFSFPCASFQNEETAFLFLMGVLGLSNDKMLYILTANYSSLTPRNHFVPVALC